MTSKLFAHSRSDRLLVMVAVLQFGILVSGVLTFGAVAGSVSLLLGAASVFLMCTNYMCVAHNFIHNPFFTSRRLNRVFGAMNSLLIGAPQSLHRVYHLHHHRYNNDARDPAIGTTRDVSSTWRHSLRPEREEGMLTYALLSYFRTPLGWLLRETRKRRLVRSVIWESVVFATLLAVLALLNPLGVAAFYLPVWFLGNVAAQAENYLEHHGATPGNRQTDSVSSYGRLYNLIWFNNGYHQEHHYRPQTHWTRLPEIKELLPPESQRRVVRGAHWFNFGIRRALDSSMPAGPEQSHVRALRPSA